MGLPEITGRWRITQNLILAIPLQSLYLCDYAILPLFAILAWTHSCWNIGGAMGIKRSWWHTIRKLLVVIVIIVACAVGIALIVGIIGGYLYHWVWTGITTKTLWDC